MAAHQLTEAERELVDQFDALLKSLLTPQHSSVSVSRFHGFASASAQDGYRAYTYCDSAGRSMADRLQSALDAHAENNLSDDERRAAKIAELKSQLERLESAA